MNKRYIDFVPAKGKVGAKKASKPIAKPVSKPAARPMATKPVVRFAPKTTPKPTPKKVVRKNPLMDEDFEIEEMFVEREQPAGVSASRGIKLGVIEEYQPKFVQTEVKKRPLGSAGARGAGSVRSTASTVRSTQKGVSSTVAMQKIVKKPATKPAVKPAYRPAPLGQRTTFLNTNKIEKRPLSKNVYTKKPVVIPKEEKIEKPVKIIEKPEKDSKAGLVIAIILTIILGAAAGTVAFLLLPK